LIHWYCRADAYNSFEAAMTDYSGGGYALMGVFAACAAVAVLLEGHGHMRYERNAPRFDEEMYYVEQSRPHNIIVYDRVEPRFTLEDFYCKLQLCFPKD